jgi:hypothetical protein
MADIIETPPEPAIAAVPNMTITVNGKEFALENTPRLRWSDIGRMAGVPMGRWTNTSSVTVTVPGSAARQHLHGFSLIVVDGMSITAQA